MQQWPYEIDKEEMRFGVRRLQKTEGKWQLLQLLQSDCETVGERERKKEREMEESDYDQ